MRNYFRGGRYLLDIIIAFKREENDFSILFFYSIFLLSRGKALDIIIVFKIIYVFKRFSAERNVSYVSTEYCNRSTPFARFQICC